MDIKLIQLTDCHLLGDAGARFKGVSPFRTLQQVCAYIQHRHADTHALLLTGDLSQDQSDDSYRLLRQALEPLARPAYALPGNHDNPAGMQTLTGGRIRLDREPVFGRWQVLMAHSNVPGRVEGRLDDEQLKWLEASLTEGDHPRLLALHHPPLAIGSPWMDRIGLRNGEALIGLACRSRHLKCIVHGHTHQAGCVYAADLPCYGTPSTWRQFVPGVDTHRMATLPPALRVIRLNAGGCHSSWVEFVQTRS